jgi:hypothetical protein
MLLIKILTRAGGVLSVSHFSFNVATRSVDLHFTQVGWWHLKDMVEIFIWSLAQGTQIEQTCPVCTHNIALHNNMCFAVTMCLRSLLVCLPLNEFQEGAIGPIIAQSAATSPQSSRE